MTSALLKRRRFLAGATGASLAAGAALRNSALAEPGPATGSDGHPLTALGALGKPSDRHPLFDFTMTDGSGAAIPLSRFRGRNVILHCWATWCGPCLRELPELDAFYARHKDVATILPVALASGTPASVAAFYKAHGITALPVLTAEAGAVQKAYGDVEMGLPDTLLLDASGRLIGEANGAIAWDAADASSTLAALARGT
ncbi:TlpA disulfide reductase family protein [Acidomonas methanolica]|uniref:TlpA disulfide reductase family protein n=1 Tax=Acidomonas methanolica TaxID=437 RepID=UPI002119D1DA|nr:TlpA disulfide reductase family protein [Acidomonas methanolica]MCQ9154537.1 TlpA family protein disulfide reductase [Acidomonas methanolica]